MGFSTGGQGVDHMSECYFIGGPLDDQYHDIAEDTDQVTVPEMTFTWVDVGEVPADLATIQRWRHRYVRHPDSPDTFLHEGTRRK